MRDLVVEMSNTAGFEEQVHEGSYYQSTKTSLLGPEVIQDSRSTTDVDSIQSDGTAAFGVLLATMELLGCWADSGVLEALQRDLFLLK